jgi:lipopolysaccharide transport system ATP-binding protein
MSSEIAIKVENLSKDYEIYEKPQDRLKQFVLPHLQGAVGQNRQRYFREFSALKNVSFEITKGETVGIIGRNGSGKSTLLQMICGTLNPSSGRIQTNGRIAALLELGSGFNPEFTGRENVYMNASVLGLTTEQINSRFEAITSFAEIGDFVEQPVKTYSSGMLVRLAFAVIAHVDADILIVDEALAVGDVFFTQKCMRFLRNFMKTGTVLFVSHDTSAVVNLCTRAILMDNGKVVEVGSPKDVTERYLVSFYESSQKVDGVASEVTNVSAAKITRKSDYRDMRDEFIKNSNLRNDIEVFQFKPDQSAFGTGDAKITSVQLLDEDNTPLLWIVGGEDVVLEIRCVALKTILRPIVGFLVKDRLGQTVFADNTFLVYQKNPREVVQGGELIARFEFRLPVLPSGDYSVAVAIAEGSQENHIQHNWMHDALVIRVHASSICFGVVGVPMKNITLVSK